MKDYFQCPNCKRVIRLKATKKGGLTGYCVPCNLRIFWTPREQEKAPRKQEGRLDLSPETSGAVAGDQPAKVAYDPDQEYPYRCLLCGKQYKSAAWVDRHLNTVHTG